jgi:hypothetical protein
MNVGADDNPAFDIFDNNLGSENLLKLKFAAFLSTDLYPLLFYPFVEEIGTKDSLNLFDCDSLCKFTESP